MIYKTKIVLYQHLSDRIKLYNIENLLNQLEKNKTSVESKYNVEIDFCMMSQLLADIFESNRDRMFIDIGSKCCSHEKLKDDDIIYMGHFDKKEIENFLKITEILTDC